MAFRDSALVFLLLGVAVAVGGCPDDGDGDDGAATDASMASEECQEAAQNLQQCGSSLPAGFFGTCDNDIALAADCHPDCEVDVTGCYFPNECRSPEEIASCVSSAFNFESCLCDDPFEDTETEGLETGGPTDTGATSTGDSTGGTGGTGDTSGGTGP